MAHASLCGTFHGSTWISSKISNIVNIKTMLSVVKKLSRQTNISNQYILINVSSSNDYDLLVQFSLTQKCCQSDHSCWLGTGSGPIEKTITKRINNKEITIKRQ